MSDEYKYYESPEWLNYVAWSTIARACEEFRMRLYMEGFHLSYYDGPTLHSRWNTREYGLEIFPSARMMKNWMIMHIDASTLYHTPFHQRQLAADEIIRGSLNQ